jgi:hypothetical protein
MKQHEQEIGQSGDALDGRSSSEPTPQTLAKRVALDFGQRNLGATATGIFCGRDRGPTKEPPIIIRITCSKMLPLVSIQPAARAMLRFCLKGNFHVGRSSVRAS